MTLAEISSSTVFDRSSVSGPWSWQVWFAARAVGGVAPEHRPRRRQAGRGLRDRPRRAPRAGPGSACSCTAARRVCSVGRLVDVGEAHPLHRVQVVEIAPELLEAVRGRQRVGVVAQMVLAELAGAVAEVVQELGERRRAGPQVGRAARQLRRDHAGAQRVHAGEEGVAPGRAALLGVVVGEHRPFLADPVDVGRLADHQAAMVDRRLHPADVVAHDEQDVGLLVLADQLDAAVERAAIRRVVAGDGLRPRPRPAPPGARPRCRAGPAPP